MTRDRDSKNRLQTLARKTHQYSRKFAANTAVIVEDRGQFYLYTSSSKFLPELVKSLNIPPENTFDPDAFDVLQDLKKRSPSPSLFSSDESSASFSHPSLASPSPSPLRTSTSPPSSSSYFPSTPSRSNSKCSIRNSKSTWTHDHGNTERATPYIDEEPMFGDLPTPPKLALSSTPEKELVSLNPRTLDKRHKTYTANRNSPGVTKQSQPPLRENGPKEKIQRLLCSTYF
ncbi:hypothetical protein F4678DRAFT_416912 [Xylaria arbuscula]|nr:hypothetical protein F4678DRAFT_416912 [Xylaria arbuscula]